MSLYRVLGRLLLSSHSSWLGLSELVSCSFPGTLGIFSFLKIATFRKHQKSYVLPLKVEKVQEKVQEKEQGMEQGMEQEMEKVQVMGKVREMEKGQK